MSSNVFEHFKTWTYADPVCAPYKMKYIDLIEKVERQANEIIPGIKDMSYEARLLKLTLEPHALRRLSGDMIELCKIVNKEYAPFVSD